MKRTITIDLPATLDAILVEKATGNDTPETLCATIIKEWCEPHAAAKVNTEIEAVREAIKADPTLLAKVKALAITVKPTPIR